MDTKFHIGTIAFKTPGGEEMPEIDFDLKDVVIEVKDMNVSEMGSVFRALIAEGRSVYKQMKTEDHSASHIILQRQQDHEREMREMDHAHQKEMVRIRNERMRDNDKDTSSIVEFAR